MRAPGQGLLTDLQEGTQSRLPTRAFHTQPQPRSPCSLPQPSLSLMLQSQATRQSLQHQGDLTQSPPKPTPLTMLNKQMGSTQSAKYTKGENSMQNTGKTHGMGVFFTTKWRSLGYITANVPLKAQQNSQEMKGSSQPSQCSRS